MVEKDRAPTAGEQVSYPIELTHSEDGVDLTLIRWMLSLSPGQRLEVLQENLWSIMRLRRDSAQT